MSGSKLPSVDEIVKQGIAPEPPSVEGDIAPPTAQPVQMTTSTKELIQWRDHAPGLRVQEVSPTFKNARFTWDGKLKLGQFATDIEFDDAFREKFMMVYDAYNGVARDIPEQLSEFDNITRILDHSKSGMNIKTVWQDGPSSVTPGFAKLIQTLTVDDEQLNIALEIWEKVGQVFQTREENQLDLELQRLMETYSGHVTAQEKHDYFANADNYLKHILSLDNTFDDRFQKVFIDPRYDAMRYLVIKNPVVPPCRS